MRYLPILLFLPLVLLSVRFILRRLSATRESSAHLRQEDTQANPLGLVGPTARAFDLMSAADAFDPTLAPLWDTQVPALQEICGAGDHGVDLDALLPMYLNSSRLYPELYELTSFETWLRFLEREQLVSVKQNLVRITPGGVEFLRCRVTAEIAV